MILAELERIPFSVMMEVVHIMVYANLGVYLPVG